MEWRAGFHLLFAHHVMRNSLHVNIAVGCFVFFSYSYLQQNLEAETSLKTNPDSNIDKNH